MPDLIYLLAVLVCPITMGAMMLLMRGNQSHSPQADSDEVARLRAEVNELRAQGSSEQLQAGRGPHTHDQTF